MSEARPEARSSRSGCAVFLGVLLIAVGFVFLAHNLLGMVGVTTYTFATRTLSWFGTLWPLVFIAWGVYKVFRVTVNGHPVRVSAAEVGLLGFVLVLGLAVSSGRRLLEEVSVDVSADEVAAVLGSDFLAPAHEFESEETFELDEAKRLLVETPGGAITIFGSDEELLRIAITKRVHDADRSVAERKAEALGIDFTRSGDDARVKVEEDHATREVVADLEIHVPRQLDIKVRNGRGPIRVYELRSDVDAETRNGLIEARGVGGRVVVKTSHADVRLERVDGEAKATNRHGAITLSGVGGDAVADTTNGFVVVEDVGGTARIETRRGRAQASRVTGDVRVTARYGEVSIERVGGNVELTANNRPVFVSGVTGSVTVDAKNASVLVREVGADVRIENRYRPILIRDVRGAIHVTARQSEVDIDTVAGPVTVDARHEDVRVHEFSGGLAVRSTHAGLEAVTSRLGGDIEVETTYGDVLLRIPGESAATVTISAGDGSVETDFPEIVGPVMEGETRTWRGALGGGGPTVLLRTLYGDVRVERTRP